MAEYQLPTNSFKDTTIRPISTGVQKYDFIHRGGRCNLKYRAIYENTSRDALNLWPINKHWNTTRTILCATQLFW